MQSCGTLRKKEANAIFSGFWGVLNVNGSTISVVLFLNLAAIATWKHERRQTYCHGPCADSKHRQSHGNMVQVDHEE